MSKEFNMALGAALRQIRKERGVSQEKVGTAVGITFQQLQKYERGVNRIAACKLPELAAFLNVTIAEIFERAGHIDPHFEEAVENNDSLVTARLVSKIADPAMRKVIIGAARLAANAAGAAA